MSYNLDENQVESFEFTLGGFVYSMKYPTTEELEAIQKLEGDEKQTDAMLKFITAKDEKAPDVREALKKKNVKVLQRFKDMLLTEFGAQ